MTRIGPNTSRIRRTSVPLPPRSFDTSTLIGPARLLIVVLASDHEVSVADVGPTCMVLRLLAIPPELAEASTRRSTATPSHIGQCLRLRLQSVRAVRTIPA